MSRVDCVSQWLSRKCCPVHSAVVKHAAIARSGIRRDYDTSAGVRHVPSSLVRGLWLPQTPSPDMIATRGTPVVDHRSMLRPGIGLVMYAAVACGQTVTDPSPATHDDPGAGGSDGAPAGGPYFGEITVRRLEIDEESSALATASFGLGRPEAAGCPERGVDVGGCCCPQLVFALPAPMPPAPNAGSVTISTTDGDAVLAELEPLPSSDDDSPGAYEPTDCEPWEPGAALQLNANGADIGAFSAHTSTPNRFEDVTLSLGAEPGVADTTTSWQVTWAPEEIPSQSVTVTITNLPMQCWCTVPDANGSVIIAAAATSTLAPGGMAGTEGTLSLSRTRSEILVTDDATIALHREHAEARRITFE